MIRARFTDRKSDVQFILIKNDYHNVLNIQAPNVESIYSTIVTYLPDKGIYNI